MTDVTRNVCALCRKREGELETKLLQCSRCKNRSYCGRQCQTQDWDIHKATCIRQNYLLKICLCPTEISDPPITRVLSCPARASFYDFHYALQIAFGWAITHTYDFMVKDPAEQAQEDSLSSEDQITRMMSLMNDRSATGSVTNPKHLLRIVEDSPPGALGSLSGKGVDAMYDRLRKNPNTPEKKAPQVRLFQVFENREYKDMPFEYEYDFGDHWTHTIELLGRKEATDYFLCTDGEGHGCAEDAGGVGGWEELKTAYRTERPNKDQKEKMKWYETQASNPDPQGLGNGRERVWAKGLINRRLAEMAGRAVSFS